MNRTSCLTLACAVMVLGRAPSETVSSPDGHITADIVLNAGRLSISTTNQGTTVIETSPLGFTMNGSDRGTGITLGQGAAESHDEQFASRHGVHATARDHFNGRKFTVTHTATGESYILNVRAYDSGIAFRYELAYTGAKNITAETTSFILPAGTRVSSQGGVNVYENGYGSADVSAIAGGSVMGPPMVGRLPGTAGYVAITHSAPGDGFPNPYLTKISGGTGRQFQNTYLKNGDNTYGASSGADVFSPWNVVTMGSLDVLANSDIVESVAPAPDPVLFPEGTATSWATPGRSVWDWMSRFPGGITAENSKLESYWASQCGYEYNTVDDGWAAWNNGDPWAQITDVAAYSKTVGVKVLVWVSSVQIQTRAQRAAYFSKLRDAGVSGIKADFFDFSGVSPASKERIRLIERILKEAASYHLMVDLHGTGKPLGQFRTYPNLLNIEGVYGKESYPDASTTCYVPLTRFLAGPADYTPLGLQGKLQGGQTQAFEIASVMSMAGPLVTLAERGDRIAQSPFASVIKAIPCYWDETRVLDSSDLGESCAMARRKGTSWFVGIMNAKTARSWPVSLSFLTPGVTYQAEIVRDGSTALEYQAVTSETVLNVNTAASGGFVARFTSGVPAPVSVIPFDTSFSAASGTTFAENGEMLVPRPWASPFLGSRLPDLLWSISGTGLTPSLDYTSAWLGGSSIKVAGTLQGTSDLALFGTDVALNSSTRLSLAFRKSGTSADPGFKVGLVFSDAPTAPVIVDPGTAGSGAWQTQDISLGASSGRTLKSIFIRFASATAVPDYSVNIGHLALYNGTSAPVGMPAALQANQVVISGLDALTAALQWQASTGPVHYYRVYQRNVVTGERQFLGATDATSFSVSTNRMADEPNAVLEVAAVGADGSLSPSASVSITLPPRPLLTHPLSGTVIGTTGSFQGSTSTRDKVYDGDVTTFFDAAVSDGVWAGVDLGASMTSKIVAVRYYPRDGWSTRMTGGSFQGANTANFIDAVTLATVATQPTEGQYTLVAITNTQSFRYLRYLSPNGGWGNVAEVTFYGPGAPAAPLNVSVVRRDTSASVRWSLSATAVSYRIKRSTVSGGPYEVVADGVTGTSWSDATLSAASSYFYVVSAVGSDSTEGVNSTEAAAVDLYGNWLTQQGITPGSPGSAFDANAAGSGVANGIRYAIETPVKMDSVSGGGTLLTVDARDDEFLNLLVQGSSDLTNWTPIAVTEAPVQAGVAAGFRRVAYLDPQHPEKRFYRIMISR